MSNENPFKNLRSEVNEVHLNEYGEKAMQDLKVVLEAKRIPDEERVNYINALENKIKGETDEDMIDMALGNILLDVTKRAKLLKESTSSKPKEEQEQEKACAKCGRLMPVGDNFCRACGTKF